MTDIANSNWRIWEGPGCGGCSYEGGRIFCRKPNCSGRWAIYDAASPQTEEYYYGLVALGFETLEQAEKFLKGN